MPLKVTHPYIHTFPYSAGVSTHLTDKEGYDFCPGEALLVNMETGETEERGHQGASHRPRGGTDGEA